MQAVARRPTLWARARHGNVVGRRAAGRGEPAVKDGPANKGKDAGGPVFGERSSTLVAFVAHCALTVR